MAVWSHLKQVLTDFTEDLIQTLVGLIYIGEAEDPHTGEHLQFKKKFKSITRMFEAFKLNRILFQDKSELQ